MRIPQLNRLLVAGTATAALGGGLVAAIPATATAAPAAPAEAQAAPKFQLPFACGQKWQLNTWAHTPALDMVKEPSQHGTEGAALLAPASGIVVSSYWHDNAGNVVQIRHGGRHYTTYLHMKYRSVSKGTWIARGAKIGAVGKTGPTANKHPHLHYEQGYDKNNNGSVTWGYGGAERVAASFNGKKYTGRGKEWDNVKSANKCAPKKHYVSLKATGTAYVSPTSKKSAGRLNKGRNYVFCVASGRSFSYRGKSKYWLYTELDAGLKTGWVSAAYLGKGGGRPKDAVGRVIPFC
ncbi:M23 family metallopeptidase [Actinomadura fulvescens]|uniref:M23ase beta-sheet core domain-containing protein n=1 Tax=Actinomadura fulvescens TaxID=46160 RepID=A0ABN3PZ38_9ACTN